ncbi:hypothetical protein DXG03_002967 [Asterophora parasitica]|uniref:Uncharacterized protein n=1 Tax=Asterophora parasitica TaxID=117018 RepID=A0A9P7FWD1_9AGAR|nr:hypothetical protein DXG03_002967 [Asterophora parasitica]
MKRAITIKTDVYNAFEHANFNTVEGLKTYAGKARECIKNNSVKERDAGYSDDYPTAAAKPPANNLPPAVATTSGNRDDHLADGMASMNIIDKKGKRKAGGK